MYTYCQSLLLYTKLNGLYGQIFGRTIDFKVQVSFLKEARGSYHSHHQDIPMKRRDDPLGHSRRRKGLETYNRIVFNCLRL
jgi:hypothetical protein